MYQNEPQKIMPCKPSKAHFSIYFRIDRFYLKVLCSSESYYTATVIWTKLQCLCFNVIRKLVRHSLGAHDTDSISSRKICQPVLLLIFKRICFIQSFVIDQKKHISRGWSRKITVLYMCLFCVRKQNIYGTFQSCDMLATQVHF